MAERQRRHHVYGRTYVSGYATVQQGDNFHINNIRIDQAVFNSMSIGATDPTTASTRETRKRRRGGSEDDDQDTKRKCCRQRWVTGDSDRCLSGKEFVSVLTALTMFLIGRHASAADVMRFIVRYRDDPWSHIATFVFGFGLTRYWMSHVPNSPSLLTDDRITLEDVFRQDVAVPFSTYADFSILKAFLNVHYRGTPAEDLVKGGQFNLMLNSRRGLVLHEDDWSAKEIVKPESLIVMAVCIRLQRPICLMCSSGLQMTATGEFWCEMCERLYRDCHDLRYINGLTVSGTKIRTGSGDPVEPPKRSGAQNSEMCSSGGEERRRRADLSSLKNVDLELIPPQRPHRPGQVSFTSSLFSDYD